jgi:N-acetylneuraminate synthase
MTVTNKVFIIAEAGSNWKMGSPQNDIQMAKTLISIAAEAGADAVKFQVFRAPTIYASSAGYCDHLREKGVPGDIHTIFRSLEMPYELIPELAAYTNSQGLEFMASFFSKEDFQAVDPYVRFHKIASPELHHPRLLELAAASGKQTFLSTGISEEEEIDWAIECFRKAGGKKLTLMQCTVQYPVAPEGVQLQVLTHLQQRYQLPIGLSDHSLHPTCAPVAAVAMGATVIEKHFTLDRRLVGPDHSWAINPQELKEMVQAIRLTEQMLGAGEKMVTSFEKPLRKFSRRSVQAIKDIQQGDHLQEGVNIDALRPGKQTAGVHPRYLDAIEGKQAKRKITCGEGLQVGDWE